MSLSLPQWLNCLAAAQAGEVAPALALAAAPDASLAATDANYAAGTAATTALLLMLAAAEASDAPVREAALAGAARPVLGPDADGRDARCAALGARLADAEHAGDAATANAVLALLLAEAEAEMMGLGLPLPVPISHGQTK
ncbi:hypothetical protein [Sandarakinorhabdus sp.]|uniref:hypothetical protein n=1 Tax=Sandarakinorhabdus sp. TaxID=1916663 RepID=UPI00286DF896|nr:hypothetical protein [Sandarakinorhabdus sp.]